MRSPRSERWQRFSASWLLPFGSHRVLFGMHLATRGPPLNPLRHFNTEGGPRMNR